MKYQVLIFMSKDRLSAIDIGADGKVDEISIDGNNMIAYTSKVQIEEFCRHIKNYYNIEDFSDLEMSVFILRFDALMQDVFVLLDEIREAQECNLVSAEKAILWFVLKEGLIKAGTAIQISVFGVIYTVSLDNNLILNCQIGGKKEDSFAFPKEKFAEYSHLSENSLIDYEDEKNELCKKFVAKLKEKERQIEELRQQLIDEKGKRKNAEDKLKESEKNIEENERSANRYICKLEKDYSHDNPFALGLRRYKYNLECHCHNTEIVKRGQKIAVVEVSYSYTVFYGFMIEKWERSSNDDFVITAAAPGRLFWLHEQGTELEYGSDIAVIGDISDTKEDVMKWYEKNK